MADEVLGITVGRKASLSKKITAQDIELFAKVTGDTNPLHLDEAFAKRTRFKKRVCHGMLSAGLISAVLGTKLAGPNASPIYLGQSMRFLKPVFIGDTVTASIEVKKVDPARRILIVSTECSNQDGQQILTGEATMMVDPLA